MNSSKCSDKVKNVKEDPDYLRDVWNSMFNSDIVKNIDENDSELQSTVMLLETALLNVKRASNKCSSLQNENQTLLEEFNKVTNENLLLKDEINSLKSAKCSNCRELKKTIMDQQVEILEMKKRIQTIASILNFGNVAQGIPNRETQSALLMMNEMLDSADVTLKPSIDLPKTPPRLSTVKKRLKLTFTPPKNTGLLSPKMAELKKSNMIENSPVKFIVIPETEEIDCGNRKSPVRKCEVVDSQNAGKVTPVKVGDNIWVEERSPILERSAKRKKVASDVENFEQVVIMMSNRELQSKSSNHSVKKSQLISKQDKKHKSPTLENKSPKKLSPKKKEPEKKWLLRANRYCSDDLISTRNTVKKFKQTTISLKPKETKKDITKLKSYNGGVHSSSSSTVVNINGDKTKDLKDVIVSDEEIVESSPIADVQNKSLKIFSDNRSKSNVESDFKKPNLNLDNLDDTLFEPPAASTCKINCSFDRVPGRECKSPNYKYQRDAVRKKSERMKLAGWDCDNCAKYYEASRKVMNPAQVKQMMDKCSRHRDKFQYRQYTPPGFWDPLFPSSDEEDEIKDK